MLTGFKNHYPKPGTLRGKVKSVVGEESSQWLHTDSSSYSTRMHCGSPREQSKSANGLTRIGMTQFQNVAFLLGLHGFMPSDSRASGGEPRSNFSLLLQSMAPCYPNLAMSVSTLLLRVLGLLLLNTVMVLLASALLLHSAFPSRSRFEPFYSSVHDLRCSQKGISAQSHGSIGQSHSPCHPELGPVGRTVCFHTEAHNFKVLENSLRCIKAKLKAEHSGQ